MSTTTGRAGPTVDPDTGLRTWILALPWPTSPLQANGPRGNPFAHARQVKQVRATARALAQAQRIPRLARAELVLRYTPRDRRRRDPGNLWPLRKALEDGIVDAGVLADDTPDLSEPAVPVIDQASGRAGRLVLLVRELPPLEAPA